LSRTNLLTYHHFPTKLSRGCFNHPCLQYKSQPKGEDDVKNVLKIFLTRVRQQSKVPSLHFQNWL